MKLYLCRLQAVLTQLSATLPIYLIQMDLDTLCGRPFMCMWVCGLNVGMSACVLVCVFMDAEVRVFMNQKENKRKKWEERRKRPLTSMGMCVFMCVKRPSVIFCYTSVNIFSPIFHSRVGAGSATWLLAIYLRLLGFHVSWSCVPYSMLCSYSSHRYLARPFMELLLLCGWPFKCTVTW